jgi:N4-(beta-N-acetylglucosaminyl)-L-asparaginase
MPTTTRRRFLVGGLAAAAASVSTTALWPTALLAQSKPALGKTTVGRPPVVISSANGLRATARAYELLQGGADPLDAAIAGVNIIEDDPLDESVGLGGLPNEEGVVELDSSCMHGPTARGGAVAALQNIRNPSQVAKLVAFRTDHVLLVGEGALRFARAHGFKEENLLTESSRMKWLHWKETLSDQDDWLPPPETQDKRTGELVPARPGAVGAAGGVGTPGSAGRPGAPRAADAPAPWRPRRGHVDFMDEHVFGTVNCNVLDALGNLAGCTSTSGLAYKIPGRVGDSPILGAGLYVDNAVGAAGSTGRGEENLQRLGSFVAVEQMRQGKSPLEAGMEVLRRVAAACERRLRDAKGRPQFDIKYYIVNKKGEHAGVSMWSGGKYAVTDGEGSRLMDCAWLLERDKS